jgi:hypothetical protein
MKYLTLLLIAITTLSCNPSKKLDKLNRKHPELLANFCRDTFPCVISKVDTITSFDTIYTDIKYNDYEGIIKDTIWITNFKTKVIDKPVVIAYKNSIKYITKTIKDSAEIKACQLELNAVNKKLIESTALNTKLQNKVTGRNSAIMWLIIALLCSIIINVILIKKW